MATSTIRRTAAWTLAALLTIIAGAGEGLHLIPGLGHGVKVGERVLVLGQTPAGPSFGLASFSCCECSGGEGSLPVLDEDDCPICQIVGASFAPSGVPLLCAADMVVVCSPAALAPAMPRAPGVYHARGPPLPAIYGSHA